jgi:small subunit ribosomal protein S5
VRAVLELGGVRDVLTKSIGTQNPINLVKATMDGLMQLRRPEQVAELRGLSVKQVLGLDLEQEGASETSDGEAPAEPVAVATEPEAAAEPAPAEPPAEEAAPGGEPS